MFITGHINSLESREKMRLAHLGYKFSEEAKKKMSLAKIGKPGAWLGKKRSDETKLKISLAHKGKKLSEEHKQKLREMHKIPWNKGLGICSTERRIRNSKEYKLWRKSVFDRDNYTCIWCGAKNGKGETIKFEIDHIKPFALYPELRFAIDNGRTLCKKCHNTTKGGRLIIKTLNYN